MDRKFQIILAFSVVAVAVLWQLSNQTPTRIPPLPQEYDIDALNAQIAAMPKWNPPTTLEEHRDQIVHHMREFMTTGGATYSEQHVGKCDALLSDFISRVRSAGVKGKRDEILSAVKATVVALNTLNHQCDDGLIETMEREDICEMLFFGANQAGLPAQLLKDTDITMPEREW